MVEELPKILGHIEKMEELDLDGVEPTSHDVQIENVLLEGLLDRQARPGHVLAQHVLDLHDVRGGLHAV